MTTFFHALLLLIYALCSLGAATPAEDAAATVVIYNANDSEAKPLADFYCSSRGIDPTHQIAVRAPLTEEISRDDYDAAIASPLRLEFTQRGYWVVAQDIQNHPIVVSTRIRYAALIRGMPLKIKDCGSSYPGDATTQPEPFGSCNAASVDSELSILGLFTSQISGVIKNPYCGNSFQSVLGSPIPPALLFVSRLDAPTADSVRTMILDGLRTEKEGLWGWGYADLRSITTAGYVQGDQWIKSARDSMRSQGIPVISDDLPETFQSGFPVTDAAAYYGWYSENLDGPFADPFFQFVPGAVAVHIHSFSATTLRNPAKGWTGPLVSKGAAASVGNVYEPYLSFTTDLGVFASTLLAGRNLAESYYAAQPVLSWMSISVGDPLYRPYTMLREASPAPDNSVWRDYRDIILAHNGNVLKSASDLVARSRLKADSLYLEALGAAQSDAGIYPAAEASFREAGAIARDPRIQFRLLLELARTLEKEGHPEAGAALLRQGLLRFNSSTQRSLLLSWIQRLDPIKPTSPQNPAAH
jgi:uncharacterized protein (TIGR03790 family)